MKLIKQIITRIREFLTLTDYCPRHKVPYEYHLYSDKDYCPECRNEDTGKLKKGVK